MSKQIIGTPEQSAQFEQVLEELKNVPGPVRRRAARAGHLRVPAIEVQSRIGQAFGVSLEEGLRYRDVLFAIQPQPEGKVHHRHLSRHGLLRQGLGSDSREVQGQVRHCPGRNHSRSQVHARRDALHRLLRLSPGAYRQRRGLR